MNRLLTILKQQHDRGRHSIACDSEACQHYGISEAGAGMRVWRLRCYASGFFSR
jgi:hypothetical protein